MHSDSGNKVNRGPVNRELTIILLIQVTASLSLKDTTASSSNIADMFEVFLYIIVQYYV